MASAADAGGNGGLAARRAVTRWAWRLFRCEWRQQLLVLVLIVIAVAATVLGATVATNSPAVASGTFGSAQDLATFPLPDPHLATQLALVRHDFGSASVLSEESLPIPATGESFELESVDPHGPYLTGLLALTSGHWPRSSSEIAVSTQLASTLGLHLGGKWHTAGRTFRVVGTVENPGSLLDDFALVAPGQVRRPTQVSVLFDAGRRRLPSALAGFVVRRSEANVSSTFNPVTISIAAVTLGMLLIALMAVGGFTVLAQRRLRSLGMLSAIGATRRHVSLVVRANALVVGVAGAVLGTLLGFAAWLAYRPHLESSSHHLIGVLALPWVVVGFGAALAIVASYLGASRPARSIARIPIVAALAGRPQPPKQLHRSAVPGVAFLVGAFLLLGYAGAGNSQPRTPVLVAGLVALIPGVILLAPFFLSGLARLGRHLPVAPRLALRDLARYRARSGSALAAISIGVLVSVIIVVLAAARYSNTLDYAGPNLASNQLVVYTPVVGAVFGPHGSAVAPPITARQQKAMAADVRGLTRLLGARGALPLLLPDANLNHVGSRNGRNFTGQIYVGTPALLATFGISARDVERDADVLTMRGLSGLSGMQLLFGASGKGGPSSNPCPPHECLANPVIEQVNKLPSGTSAPNTVITEHAMRSLGLNASLWAWFIQTPQPLSGAEIASARETLAADDAAIFPPKELSINGGLSMETKNDAPNSWEVTDWATLFGILLALAILAMSVGLVRSETAGDLRTLAATGASSSTRRTLTAITAGALGFLGALLGTLAGYVGVLGWVRDNSLNGGIGALANVPVANLLLIVFGIPLLATAIGWLLAGREPAAMSRPAIE